MFIKIIKEGGAMSEEEKETIGASTEYFDCLGTVYAINASIRELRKQVALLEIEKRHDKLDELSEQLMSLKNQIEEVAKDIQAW